MIHRIFILSILLFPAILLAQFEQNKHIVGPSVGFSFLGSTVQFGANHEYGFSLKDIGVDGNGSMGIGGIFRYWVYSEETTNVKSDYTDVLLGFQTNYHFYMPNDRVDPWVGFILAYDFGDEDNTIKTSGYELDDDTYAGFWIGAQAGLRYWVKNNIGLNLRIGFGIQSYGFLDLGLEYKLN